MSKWKYSTKNGIYKSWVGMMQRAGNKDGRHPTYADVSVCERWFSYDNFMEDMGPTWFEGACLDKDIIDAENKIYCPEKCLWVENGVNVRESVMRNHQNKQVLCITTGKLYNSINEAAKDTGALPANISNCCHHKSGYVTANGLEWQFVSE